MFEWTCSAGCVWQCACHCVAVCVTVWNHTPWQAEAMGERPRTTTSQCHTSRF
jgi:hypothetical protein